MEFDLPRNVGSRWKSLLPRRTNCHVITILRLHKVSCELDVQQHKGLQPVAIWTFAQDVHTLQLLDKP